MNKIIDACRQTLREIGYQAGQHELLADNLIKVSSWKVNKKLNANNINFQKQIDCKKVACNNWKRDILNVKFMSYWRVDNLIKVGSQKFANNAGCNIKDKKKNNVWMQNIPVFSSLAHLKVGPIWASLSASFA